MRDSSGAAGSGLWEREPVMAAVQRSLARLRDGSGSALFVLGEAGLGKTSVLERAREEADANIDVGFARGEVMEGSLPFGLAAQALRSLGESSLALTIDSGEVPAVEPSTPFQQALRWLEQRDDRPLLLALDDLHWADVDSLRLVAFLARRLDAFPVAVVATLRPWPAQAEEVARDLAASGHADLERLEPLSRRSGDAMLRDRYGDAVSVDVAERVWELCQGNPLLMDQLALTFQLGAGVPAFVEHTPALGAQMLLPRFAGLDGDGLAWVRAASVLGTTFRPDVATEVADIPERAIDATLEALFRSGLVVESERDQVRFAHPLLAQALYDDLGPPRRQRLHARAFEAVVARDLRAAACEHAVRADLVGDRAAIDVLERSGRSALRAGAVVSAARDLEAAVRFSGDRASPRLSMLYCAALTASGRMDDVAGECRRLLDDGGLEWVARVEVLRMLGRALYLMGAADEGEAVLEEAVALAVAHDPPAAIQPLLDHAFSAWLAGGTRRALPLAARARGLAAGSDASTRERANATWGYLALESGDAEGLAATSALARYLDPATRTPPPGPSELAWPWAPIYQFAMTANYTERHADAEHAFRFARAIVERADAANALAAVTVLLANVLVRRGRLEEALAEAIRAEELSDLAPGAGAYSHLARAEALTWLGRLDEAERHCAEAERRAPGAWFVRLWLAHLRGLALLWQGDGRASDELRVAEEITHSVGIGEPCHMHWAGHAIAAHVAVGRVDDARRVVDWLDSCAHALPCRWPRITAEVGRARLASHTGDHEQADTCYRAALTLHDEIDLPLTHVETLLARGSALRTSGRPAEARPPLALALDVAERTGAYRLAADARSELGLAGGRRRRRAAAPGELTPAETRVAELAAAGRANAEIATHLHLSVNTVESHLKRVYAKLGISSRRELIVRARARGAPTSDP